jgi:hypothetical protein
MSGYIIYMRYNTERPHEVSKPNKDMIEFADKYLDQINRTGTEITLTLIDQDNTDVLKKLEKKGVTKLPALLGNGLRDPIQKVEKIKKFLLSATKSKKPIPNKREDEALQDYQWGILEQGDDNINQDGKRNDAEVRAKLEFEARRRDRGQNKTKAMTADEIVANQRRGRASHSRTKPIVQDSASDDSDDEDEQPRRKSKRSGRKSNIDPNPADIISDMPAHNRDEQLDNDLSVKFWSGRGFDTE